MNVTVQRLPDYDLLYNLPKDINFVICIGGRGGAKTYEVSKYAIVQATINKKRIVVLRDEKSLIKESILNEIWERYETANENNVLDQYYIKNDYELKDKETGKVLIYTKGFRASNSSKKANLKGASDIDIAIIEEGEDIRDKEKFYTFIDSLRKSGCIIIMILNTPDIHHFIVKNYFNCIPTEHDGYFDIVPKRVKGFACIKTTYENNPFLPQHIIDRYESYGDKNSPLYDLHYYLTAIKGYAGTGRKGQIHKNVRPISLEEYMKLPFKEYYGQDFGTASPAGLIGVKIDRNNTYARELNYLPMSLKSIGINYCKLNFTDKDRIVVDTAEPQWRKLQIGFRRDELSPEEIEKYPRLLKGFNVAPCRKGIKTGLSLANSFNMYAVETSKNLWNEINNRVYEMDKSGNYTDEPEPGYDHLMDGWIYVLTDRAGWNPQETITIKRN